MAGPAPTLATLVALGITLVLGIDHCTDERVTTQAEARRAARLADVLPGGSIAAALPTDRVADEALRDAGAPRSLVRYWRDGTLDALAMTVVAPDGYSGDIVLLIGAAPDGRIGGVRVLEHRETPGLGDDIERRRSDWITRFDGLALHDLPSSAWAVRPRGGSFDAFTGATLTPQAVVRAVYRTLDWLARRDVATLAARGEPTTTMATTAAAAVAVAVAVAAAAAAAAAFEPAGYRR